MRISPDCAQFNPVCLTKQSHPSRPLKPFTFTLFSMNKRLHLKETVQALCSTDRVLQGYKLLLLYGLTTLRICLSSVARWIVTMLKLAGIDTDTFKSHSVKSASATAAASAGITAKQIMEAAGWRSVSFLDYMRNVSLALLRYIYRLYHNGAPCSYSIYVSIKVPRPVMPP